MTDSSITPNESMANCAIIAKGLVENLARVIIDGFKSIYALRAKEDALPRGRFRLAVQSCQIQ